MLLLNAPTTFGSLEYVILVTFYILELCFDTIMNNLQFTVLFYFK